MPNSEHNTDEDLRTLAELLAAKSQDLPEFLGEMHAADIASWMQYGSEQDIETVFRILGNEARAEVFEFATYEVESVLVPLLSTNEMIEVVEALGVDEAVDLLDHAPLRVAEQVIESAEDERAKDLRRLRGYAPDTAGGVMTTDFATIGPDGNIGDAIKALRQEDEHTIEEEAGLFIVDQADHPLGWLSDRDLITTPIHTPVRDVMAEIPVTISAGEDQEEAAILVARYNLHALAVVDDGGALIGVVTSDDAGEVFEEEAEEDIRRLVGTSTDEQTHLPILTRVRQRSVERRVKVSSREIDSFLATTKSQGGQVNEFHLGHILIAIPEAASTEQISTAKERAIQVLTRVTSGEDFAALAAEFSDGQQALQGGDLGGWGDRPGRPRRQPDHQGDPP